MADLFSRTLSGAEYEALHAQRLPPVVPKPHWNLATDDQKRVPLPVELSPDRFKAASDMPAGIAPFMIVKEAFDSFNDFIEP